MQAGVKVGSIVYCAGAGPVGLCAAQSAMLMGAACVFISDHKPDRLKLAEQIGCHTIDLNKMHGGSSDAEAIMAEIAKRLPPEKNGDHQLVDCSIDCVGYECCGCGRESSKRVSEQVSNTTGVGAFGAKDAPLMVSNTFPRVCFSRRFSTRA